MDVRLCPTHMQKRKGHYLVRGSNESVINRTFGSAVVGESYISGASLNIIIECKTTS